MVSTPFVPVPPPRYGGTELIVWELCEGLRARGHEVTLFTVGVDDPAAGMRSRFREPVWPPEPYRELEHAAWSIAQVVVDGGFDVVHGHLAALLPLARFSPAPILYTLHHDRDERLTALYREHEHAARLVAISARQRALLPELSRVGCVHHGVDPGRYPLGDGGGPAAFLGRFAAEKAPHLAIDVARDAGCALTLAGAPHWRDEAYFEREVRPRLADGPSLSWVGEVGHRDKVALLSEARALLFPICWEEPFGLVMIEAMLCGTPVIALRRGSVPEVVDDGVTGWICDSPSEMAERLAAADRFDRAACRARAAARFSRLRMVDDYLEQYRRALAGDVVAGELAAAD